ncbi:translation initiation factor IF-2-like isoform X2 [Cygnus olor]|uniref:translation initiation factor IF-2-like isoform X2 n=1 Tax=Cygnus olor TaxID=8869 RepID=UPI001ADE65F4|nr:translation initiation factor IF-2-like isoform X2 [Cygnus olor]
MGPGHNIAQFHPNTGVNLFFTKTKTSFVCSILFFGWLAPPFVFCFLSSAYTSHIEPALEDLFVISHISGHGRITQDLSVCPASPSFGSSFRVGRRGASTRWRQTTKRAPLPGPAPRGLLRLQGKAARIARDGHRRALAKRACACPTKPQRPRCPGERAARRGCQSAPLPGPAGRGAATSRCRPLLPAAGAEQRRPQRHRARTPRCRRPRGAASAGSRRSSLRRPPPAEAPVRPRAPLASAQRQPEPAQRTRLPLRSGAARPEAWAAGGASATEAAKYRRRPRAGVPPAALSSTGLPGSCRGAPPSLLRPWRGRRPFKAFPDECAAGGGGRGEGGAPRRPRLPL